MKILRGTGRVVTNFLFAALLLIGFGGQAMGVPTDNGIAIKGYDTVAYFNAGKAIKGNESFIFTWHNMTWYFSTKENRDLFAAGPGQYAPQYDGYCAWAMTEARKALVDPEVWEIVNGKLYLQCSKAAYEKWRSDIPGNIKKSDLNWLKFTGEK